MTTSLRNRARQSGQRFATPIFGLAMGVLFFVIFAVHEEWTSAILSLAIMAAYSGVLIALGRRSETVGLLGGDIPDERGREISVKATAFTGLVLILVIVVMFGWELAQGRDGNPWAPLGAIAGLTFIGSTAWYSRHI